MRVPKLTSPTRWPTLIYLALAILPATALVTVGRPWALLALPLALFGRWGIVGSGALLRLAYIGTGFSDPMIAVDGARERVFAGLSPYGVGYPGTNPPGEAFAYGPLMLLDSIPLEVVASVALLALLAAYRKDLTLAVVAGLPFAISLASAGNNDNFPTLFLAAGLLLLPRWQGGALLGLSVAIKPYTAAFLPLAFSGGSAATFGIAVGVAAIGWLPALFWGGAPESFAILTERSRGAWPLRVAAVPLAAGALRYGTPLACVAFAALTITPTWISLGYLLPLVIVGGIAAERWAASR